MMFARLDSDIFIKPSGRSVEPMERSSPSISIDTPGIVSARLDASAYGFAIRMRR